MTNLTFSQELAIAFYSSKESHPIDLDDAWQWLGYSTKQKALQTIKNNFEEGQDFLTKRLKSSTGGRPSDLILLTVDCFKSLGMMAGTSQGKQIRKYFLECERLAKVRSTSAPVQSLAPFWYQRLLLDHKTNAVPNGYFSIFREVIPLVADLETAGYVLPDDAVPDISVGKTWANYLKSQGVNINSVARQYPHTYPDKRGTQNPNCYPESMLPMFRQWFREKYKVDHLQRYMKTKDRSALPAVDRIVRSLMAAS